MILRNRINWNKDLINDGFLYFAQRIVEMLDYKTHDIYRVPLMNSVRLMHEYIEVDNDPFKDKHLDFIYNEFRECFLNDIVIKSNWRIQKIGQILEQLDKKKNHKADLMKYLYSLINPHYFDWAVNVLRFHVTKNDNHAEIEQALRCFLPELFFKGYAKEEVLLIAKEEFFLSEVDPQIAFESFLTKFDCKGKTFDVYVGIDKSLERFNLLFANRFKLDLLDEKYTDYFNPPKNYFMVLKRNVEAIDAFHAARKVFQQIDSFTSLYQFVGDKTHSLLCNNVLARRSDGYERLVGAMWQQFSFESGNNRQNDLAISEEILSKIGKNAECALPQLEDLVRLHNRAISQGGLENGFLNFWSALEVVCINKKESNHIEQVVRTATPMIKYFYFFSIFGEISTDLKRILTKTMVQKMFNSSSMKNLSHENIACIILLPNYSAIYDKLITALCNYPVLRTRIIFLHSFMGRKSDLYNLAEKYSERVEWHMYRIYRARNSIIHAGKSPANLKDLGEHLHTYVDIIVIELIRRLMVGNACSISDAINDCLLHVDSISKSFRDKMELGTISVYDLCLLTDSWR